MKKRVVLLLLGIFLLFFMMMNVMIFLDNKNNKDIYNDIRENTNVKKIEYVNKYNDYYIVKDSKNLYLFNNEYVEITRIDLELIHDNKKDYDIVYRDENLFYMNDYSEKGMVIIEYYDIYEYKLIDKIIVGGK